MNDDWKEDLATFFEERNTGFEHTKAHAREFFQYTVANACSKLKTELQKYGQSVQIVSAETSDSVLVRTPGDDPFTYRIEAEVFSDRVRVFTQSQNDFRRELTSEDEPYDGLMLITEQLLIEDFVEGYTSYIDELSAKDWRGTNR